MCAGISAMMGEACAAGADIPFLVTAETGMFAALAGTLNAPWGAAMLHGAKHMSSAGIIGGKVLKWINSIASIGGHVVTGPTTGGIGNVAISSYLRASNAALTASFCEAMGWAFVKDYKNGLMTTKQKSKELIAFGVFNMLISGFDSHLDLENPASFLDSTISKAFGMSLANNMPSQYASFINASMKILSKHPITMVAKGLEIITPALASHLIENNGKIKDNFLENIIKGSIYSLVCGNLLGNNSNNYQITTKSKNYIIYMMNDPYIQKLIENNLISNGIKSYGKYKIDKNTLDSLESIYNELIPRITDIIKTTKGL